jgi:dTMP kinase
VIIDGSVDTLLAHVHALDQIHGTDALPGARRIVERTSGAIRPNLTIHLDVPPATITQRSTTRPGFPELLVREDFNTHFNQYFDTPARCVTRHVVRLDATLPLQELTFQATEQVISHGLLLAA